MQTSFFCRILDGITNSFLDQRHSPVMKISRALLLSFTLLGSLPVYAQTSSEQIPAPVATGAMNTITVMTPEDQERLYRMRHPEEVAKDAAKTATTTATSADQQPAPPAPIDTAAKLKANDKAVITPLKDLKKWDHLIEIYTALGNKKSAAKAIKAFEAEPERVSPQALLMVAQLYAAQDDLKDHMKLAARYYYAAQLRARFDYARWPIRGENNPYRALTNTVKEIAPPITGWAGENSTRLAEVMEDVRVWDLATSYSYLPDYALPTGDKIPEEKAWPDLLATAREAFFHDGLQIVQAMKTMGK